MKVCCIVFVCFVILVNVVAGIWQASKLYRKRFLACHGRIVMSKVRGANASDFRELNARVRTYWPQVEFDYTVGERDFRGDQISLCNVGSSEIGDIEKKLCRYPVGADVMVFYNQQQPNEAYLVHPGKHVYSFLAIAVAVTLVGGLLLYVIWRFVD